MELPNILGMGQCLFVFSGVRTILFCNKIQIKFVLSESKVLYLMPKYLVFN